MCLTGHIPSGEYVHDVLTKFHDLKILDMNPALAAVLGFQENPLPVGGGFQEDDLLGLYEESVFDRPAKAYYKPKLSAKDVEKKRDGWKRAVAAARGRMS